MNKPFGGFSWKLSEGDRIVVAVATTTILSAIVLVILKPITNIIKLTIALLFCFPGAMLFGLGLTALISSNVKRITVE